MRGRRPHKNSNIKISAFRSTYTYNNNNINCCLAIHCTLSPELVCETADCILPAD